MKCLICEGLMSKMLNLPRLPLTEMYEPFSKTFIEGRGCEDQAFMFCQRCNHGSLENIISPERLYGSGYLTQTSKSAGATQAVKNFVEFIDKNCNLSGIDTVIDIGANDYTMLDCYSGKSLVGIDPKANRAGSIPKFIENADLSHLKKAKKLIVSSHTIEHLSDPEMMISKISEILNQDDIFALQFPSLELLVRDCRIDQIHHQHVSYFSERSISALLKRHGITITHKSFDDSHWGALMLICRSGIGMVKGDPIPKERIETAIGYFEEEMMSIRIPKGTIALGASLMLPILSYWAPELGNIECISDDDKTKEGLRYVNFNKQIVNGYAIKGKDVVITALGSKSAYRSLTKRALDVGASNVILPMRTL